MQPRERRAVVGLIAGLGPVIPGGLGCLVRAPQAPGDGQRAGEVVGLGGDVSGAVSEPTWLAEQHQRLGTEQVRQHRLVGGKPRQPRLHPVEQLAASQAVHVLSAPRLAACQSRSAFAHGCVGAHFACRIQTGLSEISHRALIGHRELRETIHLVAPQVDTHGRVGSRTEHVHDPAAYRHLAAVLHLMLSPIAPRHQLRHHPAQVALVAARNAQQRRLGIRHVRAQPLQQRPDRRNDHLWHRGRSGCCTAQGLEHSQPSAHRLGRRADTLERECLPGPEERHVPASEPRAQVVGEALGFVRRGRDDQDRHPRPQRGQARRHERARSGGYSDRACAAAQHRHEARVVGEAPGEYTQRRGVGSLRGLLWHGRLGRRLRHSAQPLGRWRALVTFIAASMPSRTSTSRPATARSTAAPMSGSS